MIRTLVNFLLLWLVATLSKILFRVDLRFIGEVPEGDPWAGLRVVAILNHTSLYEPIFAGGTPNRFLWRLANHGVVPIADKTLERPIVGRFFRLVAKHVVPLTRQRDHTWRELLGKVDDPKSLLVILPEGRMMRRNDLDAKGRPMNVRGGIAEVLETIPDGRLLLAYSGGLHHIQAPGEHFPRLFRPARIRVEVLEIADYRARLMAEAGGQEGFRRAVIEDLERRKRESCPTPEGSTPPHPPAPSPRVRREGEEEA